MHYDSLLLLLNQILLVLFRYFGRARPDPQQTPHSHISLYKTILTKGRPLLVYIAV